MLGYVIVLGQERPTVFSLIKLAVVFAGIVLLMGRKWNLGFVLLLASVVIGLLFGYRALAIGSDILMTLVDVLTLRLVLAVVLIIILGELLRQTGGLKGMVEALQVLIPNARIVVAALPAVMGLLPMIGGAMFSAPMVDEVGERLRVSKERKTFVNYWFRHVWEPVFPLHPSMLLGAALLGLTTSQLAASAWPLTVAAIAGGLLFGLLGLQRDGSVVLLRVAPTGSLRKLLASIWPIVLVIVLSLVLRIDERVNLILSLLVTIALTMVVERVPARDLATLLRERVPWKTILVIFGALAFRTVLDNSGAVLAVSGALGSLQVPAALVAFGMPFIAGLLTGLMPAAYGIGIPVALPLVVTDGANTAPAWALWMMTGGFVGSMISPLHLCLALTRDYFKADWGPVYRLILPSGLLAVAVAAGALFFA